MDPMDRYVVLILAIAVTLPVIAKSRPSAMPAQRAVFCDLSADRLVAVSGEVRHPGIYRFTANALTDSVIKMAEPLGAGKIHIPKEIERLPLRNGSDIHVVRNLDGTDAVTVGAIPAAQRIVLGIPLDINAMTRADFEQVPGIGPVLSGRIVEYRQSNGGMMRPKDLLAIEGIGKVTYYRLGKFF